MANSIVGPRPASATDANTKPRTAADVVEGDLDAILDQASAEFEQMAGSSLLVTGGAGFLGYYLVQAAVHWGTRHPDRAIDVTVYDNLMRGAPAWLADLAASGRIDLVEHDVRKPLPDRMPDYDYVIHAAGIASPRVYRAHPIETMDANVNGLRAILDMAASRSQAGRPIQGLLFFSSSEIYGDPSPDAIPTLESYRGLVSCTGPRACYDESKRYGETLCVTYAQVHDIPVSMARPFNNYGPGMKITDGRVIADFARNILRGEDIVMLSDGSPTRTFCYVSDAVTGYFKVLVSGRRGEPYNIGTESPEIAMRDLANLMVDSGRRLTGFMGSVVLQAPDETEYLTDNPNRRCPSIAKARTELGYHPRVSLAEGVERALTWYRDVGGLEG